MSLNITLKNSAVSGKEPTADQLVNGEISLNYNANAPFLACKDTAGDIRRIGHAIGTTAGTVAAGDDNRFHDAVTLASTVTDVLNLNGQAIGCSDPGADRLLFWDDSASKLTHLTLGSNLSITDTTLNASFTLGDLDPSPAGTYTYATLTVDAKGRVTSALSGTGPITEAGGTLLGPMTVGTTGSISFEGSTDNSYELLLAVADPTADRTVTFPDQSGNVLISGNASIVNADIAADAAIADTKLATISTTGKVANSATTAASTNTASTIVARDASGNFAAGTITAALSGNASTATTLATARNIQGVSFNGSADITVVTAGTAITVTGTQVAVQLTDATNSTSTTTAATPNSVKAAYDLASGALQRTGGLVTGTLEIGNTGALIFEGSTNNEFELTLAVADPSADRTVTLPDATTTLAGLAVAQTFTAAQRGTISALTDGATITPDFAVANNFSVTLAGSRTLANPTNLTAGQSGVIYITQDGTGSRTLAYGTAWDFAGGTAPTLSTAANAVDVLAYAVRTTGSIAATLIKDVK